MAQQRVTLLKIAGMAGEIVLRQLKTWAAERTTDDPDEWGDDQWPAKTCRRAEQLVKQLRKHAAELPMVYFNEWSDYWSSFYEFGKWLTPKVSKNRLTIFTKRYQLHAYELPDAGRLRRRLSRAGKQQFPESDRLIARLIEAATEYEGVIGPSVIVLIREPLGSLLDDRDIQASLPSVPDWLQEFARN